MNRFVLLGLLPAFVAAPALAQEMDHSKMPGMSAPAKPVAKPKPKPAAKPKAAPKAAAGADPHAGHNMAGAPPPSPAAPAAADAHAGHAMPAMPADQPMAPAADAHAGHAMPSAAAEPEIPNTPPPPVPTDHAADRVYDLGSMAAARAQLRREHGGGSFSQVMLNIAEYQPHSGGDSYRWDGEAWFGGDRNRFVLKTEGKGDVDGEVEEAELQALYSKPISPYFDLQAGVRHDFKPSPSRTYVTVGFEGVAPYWFDLEGAVFLSNKGDILGRLGGSYDLRLTQRLILQPRAELNFAAQDIPETGVGSGLSDAEIDLRLRYEIRREFAPYIGVSYERKFGDSARFARAAGSDASSTTFVVGVRAWF